MRYIASVLCLGFLFASCGDPEGESSSSVDESVAAQSVGEESVASSTALPPLPEGGIDVSVHSGAVDWHEVAASGSVFAFVKATEGVDLRDAAFVDNWQAMKTAGVVRGAYHFYVTEDDPLAQARFFIETVDLEPGDFVPVVDIELIGHGTEPGLADRLEVWLETVEAHYRVRPIIYTSPTFWDQHLDDRFGEYPLWIAEYEVEAPRLPVGWDRWHLWQWKGDAEHVGVEHSADLSRLNPKLTNTKVLRLPHSQ